MAPSKNERKRRFSDADGPGVAKITEISSAIQTDDPVTDGPPQKKQQQRRSLFVRSLPATATTESLIAHFSQSFPIKHATAVTDSTTKQCKGYGFVTFADAEDAQRALEEFNGSTLDGKKIKIEIAEPRKRDVEDVIPGAVAAGEGKPRSQPSAASLAAKAQREKDRLEAAKSPKLIIRNLPWSIKKPEHLANLFRSYGKVKIVTLPTKKPGLLAGFGFVVLRGRKNAEKALEGLNGKEIDGRTLAVDWAVDKEEWEKQNQDAQATNDADEVKEDAEVPDPDGGPGSEEDDEDTGEAAELSSEVDSGDVEVDDDDEEEMDDADVAMEGDEDDEEEEEQEQTQDETTLFIRNLAFECDDEALKEHFERFGPIRYARIVIDPATERPRGTGFVRFVNAADAKECLRNVPKPSLHASSAKPARTTGTSILQNPELDDPTGQYTLLGRLLSLSPAVSRDNAAKLTEQGINRRDARDKDKRRLYLLSEGTISTSSPLHDLLSTKEIDMRAASAKQRQQIIRGNPSLHLSLTRLSIRNIPRSVTSKDLKALAREAVVGFATDVKQGKRERLSKEELSRGGEEMVQAEKDRKKKGKGIVKQATIVFEGREGRKVEEASGAGRSRGYGFIEYYTHRAALMGLRWLNGHAIGYKVDNDAGKKRKSKQEVREDLDDRKKRLIVEFAIENAQVVHRRSEREKSSRDRPASQQSKASAHDDSSSRSKGIKGGKDEKRQKGGRNKGNMKKGLPPAKEPLSNGEAKAAAPLDDKLAKRNRIIARKRAMRRDRKK